MSQIAPMVFELAGLTFIVDIDLKVIKVYKVLAEPKGYHYSKYVPYHPSGCWDSQFDLHCGLDFDLKVTKIYSSTPNMS